MAKALLIPLRQRTLGLQAQPAPGHLQWPSRGWARCRLWRCPAHRRCCHSHRGWASGHCRRRLPCRLRKARQPKNSMTNRQALLIPIPLQHQELLHFFRHRILSRLEHGAAFGFQLGNALRQRQRRAPTPGRDGGGGPPGAGSRPTGGGAPTAAGSPRRGASPGRATRAAP